MSAEALADVVAVIDRLVGPGGCPWDAQQSHESLAPYLIEEAYEVVDAIESASAGPGADAHLAEELGDVLLQVVFHARVAAERSAFDIGDVARGLVAKLVRRHPHVFADAAGPAVDAAAVALSWEELKAAEKPDRGLFEGIPAGLPALARAAKVAGRLRRAGLDPADVAGAQAGDPGDEVGLALFSMVSALQQDGVDAESALRRMLGRIEATATTLHPFVHPVGDDRPSPDAVPAH